MEHAKLGKLGIVAGSIRRPDGSFISGHARSRRLQSEELYRAGATAFAWINYCLCLLIIKQ